MKNERQAKLKISNELLDAMLVGVKTQEDLWGKDGIITQINKALLERILNAEMEFHLNDTDVGRKALLVSFRILNCSVSLFVFLGHYYRLLLFIAFPIYTNYFTVPLYSTLSSQTLPVQAFREL